MPFAGDPGELPEPLVERRQEGVDAERSADVDPGTGQVPLLTALSDERRTRTVVSRRASSPYYEDSGRIPLASRLSYRSEEHTSELQSRENLVCRLLLEK